MPEKHGSSDPATGRNHGLASGGPSLFAVVSRDSQGKHEIEQNMVQRKIKICFVCPKAYPLFDPQVKKVFGGAELDLYLLACELAKDADYEVSFITADYGQSPVEVIKGVTIYNGLDFKKNALMGARQLWQAMKRADADIYFQETISLGTFLVACYCHRHRGCEFIYRTAHQQECDGSYIKKHLLIGSGFRWALKHAAQVIVQNDQDQTQLQSSLGLNSQVIRNAHILPETYTNQKEFVLWAGRSAAFKRPQMFFELARCMPEERFVMLCPRATADHDYETLKKEADAIQNLEFIEGVPYEEVGGYFQRAKCYVNTSTSEGFANTFVDACKAGTAIFSLSVNPDNFIDTSDCGYYADGDWEGFVERLFEFTRNNAEVGRLGANARKYAEEKHDIMRVVELYKDIFGQVMQVRT